MFAPPGDDEMVECPYNKHHRMLRKRLQPHLIKCRLSYPNAELLNCPFNASHRVPEPEFTHHVNNCPDKALITQYKYNSGPIKIDEEDQKHIEVECEENWDEQDVEDYDPKKYASNANVIRSHIGDLPSARKAFRINERKRLGDYRSSDEEDKKDLDCMKKEEEAWYEDRGAASNYTAPRRTSFTESLKEYSRDRREDDQKRPFKRERLDEEEYPKKRRTADNPLNKDPYYRTNNEGSSRRNSGERASFTKSRKEYSRDKRDDDQRRSIKREKLDNYPQGENPYCREDNLGSRHSSPRRRASFTESKNEYSRNRRENDQRRPLMRERCNDEKHRKKTTTEDYPLDEDPYYRTNNEESRHSSSSRRRGSYLGTSRGTSRRYQQYY